MPSSRARSTPGPARPGRRRSPSSQAASARLCERAANSSCRSREIENRSASCSLASPSETVHSAGIRSLTSRQPSVVETAVTLPAGNARDGFGSTHGARVIDSTPPASTTSASPDSIVREPMHRGVEGRAAEPVDRRRRHRDRQPGQQHRHPADVAVVLAGLVGAAPDHVADRGRVERRRLGQHAGRARSRRGRRGAPRPARRRTGRTACGRRRRGTRVSSLGRSSSSTLLGDPERGVGVGHPAVDRGLQQDSLISSTVSPLRSAAAQVQRELLVVAAGDQRGQRDQRAAAPVEARAGPDRAPGVLGDQLLEVAGEVGGWRSARSTWASPSTSRRTSMPSSYAGHRGLLGRGARMIVGDLARAPRRAPGGPTPSRTTSRPCCTPSAISREAGRAGRRVVGAGHGEHGRGDLAEPVADVVRRQRAADRDVAVVVGVAQRVQQRRGARRLALEKPGANQRSAVAGDQRGGARRRGPGATRSRHIAASPILAPVQQQHRAERPGPGRRAAAAARPRRRPSRRRRGTGRRPGSSTPRGEVRDGERPSGPAAAVGAVPGQVPGEHVEARRASRRRSRTPAGVGRGAERGAEHERSGSRASSRSAGALERRLDERSASPR